jgi:DNA polymerase-3 subunit epsilon
MVSLAVVDLETTGLFPGAHHRVIEIGVVLARDDGTIEYQWDTLVNPHRDLGPTAIHGITSSMVLDAPTFSDVASDLSTLLDGRVLVAHNARFDLGFLEAEWALMGLDWRINGLCTMNLARRRGAPAKLATSCAQFGIVNPESHRALTDAIATAQLLQFLKPLIDEIPEPVRIPPPRLPWKGIRWPRTDEPVVRSSGLTAELVERLPSVGIPGVDTPEGVADSYWHVLDHALEDRVLTDDEVADLASLAESWGLSVESTVHIHLAYVTSLLAVAAADGTVTTSELADLVRVADLLGIDRGTLEALTASGRVVGLAPKAESVHEELSGKTVCFTGASTCFVGGSVISRERATMLATAAGLIVIRGVTKKLDLLVVADPDTQSSKADKARGYGTRIVAERAFWGQLGVAID